MVISISIDIKFATHANFGPVYLEEKVSDLFVNIMTELSSPVFQDAVKFKIY